MIRACASPPHTPPISRSAELAILDYLQDEELTVFTALDGEDFYEYTAEDFAKLDSHA